MKIIEQIAKDGRFKSICKKLAKKPHLVDDLLQEFHLALCEIGNEKLEQIKKDDYLEVYCVGMINNIWNKGNRITVKKNSNGKTSPFFEYCEYSIEKPAYIENCTYDIKTDICYIIAKRQIESDVNSSDRETMYKSRVFNYSVHEYKNAMQFSKDSKIPYGAVIKTYNNYRKILIEKLKKYIND